MAQTGILDAAERRQLRPVSRNFPHIDAADVELINKAGDAVEPVGAYARRKTKGGRIGYGDDLLDIIRTTNDRQDGTNEIAAQLAAPITWFFDELEGKKRSSTEARQTAEAQDWSELVTKRESRQLLELYFGIADERLRRKLMEVAQLLKTTDTE